MYINPKDINSQWWSTQSANNFLNLFMDTSQDECYIKWSDIVNVQRKTDDFANNNLCVECLLWNEQVYLGLRLLRTPFDVKKCIIISIVWTIYYHNCRKKEGGGRLKLQDPKWKWIATEFTFEKLFVYCYLRQK